MVRRVYWKLIGVLASASLAACGGGGGGGDGGNGGPSSGVAAPTYPSGGVYAPVLKATGSTGAPTFGLSLVHPSEPSVEHVVEDGRESVSDPLVVYAGSVNVAAGRVDNIQPHALVYLLDGRLKRLPLAANGAAPVSRLRSANYASICSLANDPQANDYASPDATLLVVTTKGADNSCGTADDQIGSLTFDAATNQFVGGVSPGLAAVRDPGTLAPSHMISPSGVVTGNVNYTLTPPIAGGIETRFRRVIGSAPGLALAIVGSSDADSQLAVVDAVNRSYVALGQGTAGGANWALIGHDSSAFYTFRNLGASAASSTFVVVKVAKQRPFTATVMAAATGLVSSAAMGQGQLYLTVEQSFANKLYSLGKSSRVLVEMESTARTSQTTVLTSASGVHMFLRASSAGAASGLRIDLADETGTVRTTAHNAMPMALAEPASIDPTRSENRTRFLYAAGMGSLGFADAQLLSFDAGAAGAQPVLLGRLPGSASFAGNAVFANAAMAPGNFMAGQVVGLSGGSFIASGARLFSFKADVADSMTFTTTTR